MNQTGSTAPVGVRSLVTLGFVVQVRAKAASAGADQSERLPHGHPLSFADERLGLHVAVAGDSTGGVQQVDVPSTAFDVSEPSRSQPWPSGTTL